MAKENQLQVIVKESGLEPTKGKLMLEKFQDYFEIASEWEKKAKTLIVTNATQTAEMEMARTGRLFLREKRIAVEKVRKELKEQALREGKAIDGIANVLKALIVPIEEYLDQQEHFVEKQEEAKREAHRLEIEKHIEEEHIAKEKADAEALEKARIENERLKKDAKKREEKAAEERKKQDAKLAKERAKREVERKKAEAERKAIEEKTQKERKEIEEKARKEQEAQRAKADRERKEKERLANLLKNQITCPKCGHKFQRNGKQL